ncbi:MAG: YiiX/YebB-like N1pC/P60 family cysteine hydrolase [Verrucomicrobiota bacterium]
MTAPRLRPPSGLKPTAPALAGSAAQAQLLADRDTFREILDGLNRLEDLLDHTPVLAAAAQRGYFTPDEDDRVRQALLAYRNYRFAAYDIIFRYREFAQIEDESLRTPGFLVAFAAALVLYAKSLKFIHVAERHPLLRAKLNEPDAKFDLEAGFFDDVRNGYSSLFNYRALLRADRFWGGVRRSGLFRSLDLDADWHWLCEIIRRKRGVIHKSLLGALLRYLRSNWDVVWRHALRPARRTRYGLQSLVGGRFAGIHVVPNPVHVLTEEVLAGLLPQLRPGDILLCRAEGKLSAAMLPGFWSHVAIYLGSRAELEALQVHTQPHAAKRWEQVPQQAGPLGCVIEGVAPRVRICPLAACLHADHVVVLRPNVSDGELAAALGEAFGHLGKPYDFEFDFNVSSRIVCTELVYRSYHQRGPIRFPLVKRLGRFTLSGDDVVHLALDELARAGGSENAPLRPIGLILKRGDGQAHVVAAKRIVPLLLRIRRGWRPARRAPLLGGHPAGV